MSLVSPGFVQTELTRQARLPMPGPGVVARPVAGVLELPRREPAVPGWDRALPPLERWFPAFADAAARRVTRRRSPPES